MTHSKEPVFGIAMRNFTKYPEMPSAAELIDYGVRMEELGYESIWAWDHILLGVVPSFPIHEALTILTAIAARTSKIKVGTGILVMPVRNPVILAKELATIDHISNGRLILGTAVGWYKREFEFAGRRVHPARQDDGAGPGDPQAALDRGDRRRRLPALQAARRRAAAQAGAEAASADPHRRLRRCGPEAGGHQGRRLAHLLLHRRQLQEVLGQDPRLCRGGRPQSRRALRHQPAPHLRRPARQGGRRR